MVGRQPLVGIVPLVTAPDGEGLPPVSAVLLTYNRRDVVCDTIERLRALPFAEIVVVDNASTDGTREVLAAVPDIVFHPNDQNLGIGGRNQGVRLAANELVVLLDDDSYPLAGAVETLAAFMQAYPQVALVGGLVRDVDRDGNVVLTNEVGTFDYWLRDGDDGPVPAGGFPAFFFPEGACMLRRSAFFEVGSFFEPYFFGNSEVDLTTRLIAGGWEVRYLPTAVFDHCKAPEGRSAPAAILRRRIRNQVWYFALRFPLGVAFRRIITYGLFDLVNAIYQGSPRAFLDGMADAWRDRADIRGQRRPIPRRLLARAEGNRGRLHRRVVWTRIRNRTFRSRR